MNAIARYATAWKDWQRLVPVSVNDEDPAVVARFLELAGEPGGASRAHLREQLQLTQSQESRLSRGLLAAKWLFRSEGTGDARHRPVQISSLGLSRLEELETALTKALRPSYNDGAVNKAAGRPRKLARPTNAVPMFGAEVPEVLV